MWSTPQPWPLGSTRAATGTLPSWEEAEKPLDLEHHKERRWKLRKPGNSALSKLGRWGGASVINRLGAWHRRR